MNGHDSTREQNMEARMTLAAARRGLAARRVATIRPKWEKGL